MRAKDIFFIIMVATIVACNRSVSLSEEELYINNLIAQCQDFDSEALICGMPGEWERDSYILYFDEWGEGFEALLLNGKGGASAGLAAALFTFTAEGTGQICNINYSLGADGVSIRNFDWRYDGGNRELVLSGEYNVKFDVKGYNGEYIILDHYVAAYGKNVREIYKRVTKH